MHLGGIARAAALFYEVWRYEGTSEVAEQVVMVVLLTQVEVMNYVKRNFMLGWPGKGR